MNIDNLHDALNLLDDELIEEVDKLRTKRKRRKNLSVRWLSLAACFCVAIIGLYALSNLGVWQFGASKDSACVENAKEDLVEDNSTAEQDAFDDSVGDVGTKTESISDSTGSSENTSEQPSVLVEITEWTEDGFDGVVTGIVDTTIFEIGEKVKVQFGETVYTEKDFPVGSVVRVQFSSSETETVDGDASTSIDTILYAEIIAPADTE